MSGLLKRPLILASASPRRQYLMKEAGFEFSVEISHVDEDFPVDIPAEQVPSFLARKKADFFRDRIRHEIIVTADTVVILDGEVLNKPADSNEAMNMLQRLSGRSHHVITGVSIFSTDKATRFDELTKVTFKRLERDEIIRYVHHFKPFDKAGAYGAQECLPSGMNPCSQQEMIFLQRIQKQHLVDSIRAAAAPSGAVPAVRRIEGSFFNVMGLPIVRVYKELTRW